MGAIDIGIGSAMAEQVLAFGGAQIAFAVLLSLLGAAALAIAASGRAPRARGSLAALRSPTIRLRPAVLPR